MLLEELVIENFGVYLGRQAFNLVPPSSQKPVILIAGLNGRGKTTLLDALQLVLYGKLARCTARKNLAYDEYLRRSIHRRADPTVGASIMLQFRTTSDGQVQTYRIKRSWTQNGEGVREHVEVFSDGSYDRVLTESWAEKVEEFIPNRLSQLFFFDGDKIEGLADLENSEEMLSSAIHALLGLDLVDQLSTDLKALEQRKKEVERTDSEREEVERLHLAVDRLDRQHGDLAQQRASLQNEVDRLEKQLRELDERFRTQGGELYEKRSALEATLGREKATAKQCEERLHRIAEGALPLLLLEGLLTTCDQQAGREELARDAARVHALLIERDEQVLRVAGNEGANAELVGKLTEFMTHDRGRRLETASSEQYLHLGQETSRKCQALLAGGLAKERGAGRTALAAYDAQMLVCDEIQRSLAAAPDREAITAVIEEREAAKFKLAKLRGRVEAMDEELGRARGERDRQQAVLTRALETIHRKEFENQMAGRLVTYAQKARGVLGEFRTAMIQRNARRIERLILESFLKLIRKKSLVSSVRIDPDRFSMEVCGADGQTITPDRLSGGERQLMAVSMLWGLAQASGRPLPTVIDTPLSRLDSHHRTHLVERYFPFASHQVLLLSTDEEINRHYYEKIKPFVGRAYTLHFDDEKDGTEVGEGYFW